MKRKLLAFTFILAACSGVGFAASTGIYGFGIELDGTGAGASNTGTNTMYALEYNGDLAVGGSTLSTAWSSSTSGTGVPTYNLGTFVDGQNTLTLTGGAFDTYNDSNASNVSSATLNISINGNGGPYTPVNLPFGANLTTNGDGSGHNQLWDTTSLSTNLLAGLTPGTYTVDVYGVIDTTDGLQYANNGGPNFTATFTVVPEPSTWALMFGGLGILVGLQRLRRKSVS